ncbi:Translation initiation factor 2 [Archangium gephyra]|uniref:Translation initiation factor 2 n=1 Tax=Archangium gephyra TaxID=48 RepID=A0AAC8Q358_9BACT|nr:Translation initiation factor 2 [Archangium gephyra]
MGGVGQPPPGTLGSPRPTTTQAVVISRPLIQVRRVTPTSGSAMPLAPGRGTERREYRVLTETTSRAHEGTHEEKPQKKKGKYRSERQAKRAALMEHEAEPGFPEEPLLSAASASAPVAPDEPQLETAAVTDGGVGLLKKQLASGLWAGMEASTEPVHQARATALALLELLRQGITSSHALHGAQVKKAVEALLALVPRLGGAPDVAELALGVAWLVAAGPRTRGRIAQAAQPIAGLSSRLRNEGALRQHVDALAAR